MCKSFIMCTIYMLWPHRATQKCYLLMPKLYFLSLRIIIHQHTPLYAVQVDLNKIYVHKNKKKRERKIFILEWVWTVNMAAEKAYQNTSQIRGNLRNLYIHHVTFITQIPAQLLILYPVHVDGREHVLKHGSHHFDMHALQPKIIQHQQRVVGKLLLVHPVPL